MRLTQEYQYEKVRSESFAAEDSLILQWLVTEIFAKHYCGPKLGNARFPISLWDWDVTHSSSEFWDNWRPRECYT
jgi:hypothetical protein